MEFWISLRIIVDYNFKEKCGYSVSHEQAKRIGEKYYAEINSINSRIVCGKKKNPK